MKVFGVTGWKNAGKTGLMERLVAEITERGFTVSTLKHAHHSFDVDHPGKDSHRHREAGAQQVVLSSGARWAMMDERRGRAEPPLADLLARMDPVDLVLIEGWKRDTHPKVEAWRKAAGHPVIAPQDPTILALASDTPLDLDRPVFDLDDTGAVANFILTSVGLPTRKPTAVFDRVMMVDWSSTAKPTSAFKREDALWLAEAGRHARLPDHHQTRHALFEDLCARISSALDTGQKTLIGFDFAFGYPAGFAAALGTDRAGLWAQLDTGFGPDLRNDGAKGAVVSTWCDRLGPSRFWVVKEGATFPGVPGSKGRGPEPRFDLNRACETKGLAATGAQTVFRLTGPGSVGAQSLVGIPYLARLKARFGQALAIWPFDSGWGVPDAQIVVAEIYPSLLKPVYRQDAGHRAPWAFDAMQVDLLAEAFTKADQAGALRGMFDRPTCVTADQARISVTEEGWILGSNHADALIRALS